jgi:hypothetical protein
MRGGSAQGTRQSQKQSAILEYSFASRQIARYHAQKGDVYVASAFLLAQHYQAVQAKAVCRLTKDLLKKRGVYSEIWRKLFFRRSLCYLPF